MCFYTDKICILTGGGVMLKPQIFDIQSKGSNHWLAKPTSPQIHLCAGSTWQVSFKGVKLEGMLVL